MKQAMLMIALTSLWSNGLAGFHPTPRLKFNDGEAKFFFIVLGFKL
jgi:hypothetical protein